MVARGEVRWADVGTKTRPVVLLTRDVVINRLRSLLVAPCTTTIRGLPSEVAVGPDDGVPQPCVVNLDNVSLIDIDAIGDRITMLSNERMREVCAALELAVGCDR